MPVATSPVTTMGFELVSSLQLERFQSAVMLPGRAIYASKGPRTDRRTVFMAAPARSGHSDPDLWEPFKRPDLALFGWSYVVVSALPITGIFEE